MRSIFSPDGAAALRHTMEMSPLLVFDFDGTLAPIVDDPSDAFTPTETIECLKLLQSRFTVAVVSGRARTNLVSRLGFEPAYAVGNHGAEDAVGARSPENGALGQWIRDRASAAARQLEAAGIRFEDKGFSWTLHYRQAMDHAAAQREIHLVLDGMPAGLHSFGGKCCVNVVMADAATKGQAVENLVTRTRAKAVLFMGDDVTDESVYRMSRPNWLTIHVGLMNPGIGASFYVDTQRDVVTVLRLIRGLAASLRG